MFIVIWYRRVSNFKELVSAINKKLRQIVAASTRTAPIFEILVFLM